MVSPAQIERHRAAMIRIEKRAIRQVVKEYNILRLDLRNLAIEMGLDNFRLFQVWRNRLAQFRQKLTELATGIVTTIQNEAVRFASVALDAIRENADIPNFDDLLNDSIQDRQAALQLFISAATDPIPSIEGRLGVALTDIRAGEVETNEALDLLFATTPTNGRVSVTRHGENLLRGETQKKTWTLLAVTAGALYSAAKDRGVPLLQKQAVATLDQRTTDTCKKVHRQIQDIGQPFEITGKPRYASRQQHPPFHDYCRTVEVPYYSEVK